MLNFKKLLLEDIDTIRKYTHYSPNRACDNTTGSIFMWRDFFDTQFALYEDSLYFRYKNEEGKNVFAMPFSPDIKKSLLYLYEYAKQNEQQFLLAPVAKEDLAIIDTIFSYEKTTNEDWYDYLYNAQDLKLLVGKKYNGQRNHINFFKRENPSYSFRQITEDDLPAVRQFYSTHIKLRVKDSSASKEEAAKVFEVLDNLDKYKFFGAALWLDDKVVGFAMGEKCGDTLYVHVEKAQHNLRGAWQMVVKEFASLFASEEIKIINREEDVGDEGLRISKKSYHPIAFVEKFTLNIK